MSDLPVLPMSEVVTSYYLRLRVADQAGVLARVTGILADAGISIEPHMVAVFHDTGSPAAQDGALRANFVEYGQRLERMIAEIRG